MADFLCASIVAAAAASARFFAPAAAWIEGYRDAIQHQVFYANQPPRNHQ